MSAPAHSFLKSRRRHRFKKQPGFHSSAPLPYNSRHPGPHKRPMIPPRAVLAAVSFSDTSRVELVLAARLARHCGADLHVLYVEDPLVDAAARRAGIDLTTR